MKQQVPPQYYPPLQQQTLVESTLHPDYSPSSSSSSSSLHHPVVVSDETNNPFHGHSFRSLQEIVSLLESTVNSMNSVATSIFYSHQHNQHNNNNNQQVVDHDGQTQSNKNNHGKDDLDNDRLARMEQSIVRLGEVCTQSNQMIQYLSEHQIELVDMITTMQTEIQDLRTNLTHSLTKNKALEDRLLTVKLSDDDDDSKNQEELGSTRNETMNTTSTFPTSMNVTTTPTTKE